MKILQEFTDEDLVDLADKGLWPWPARHLAQFITTILENMSGTVEARYLRFAGNRDGPIVDGP